MAGIYIHIPFCRKPCSYCNFHFTTSLKYKKEVLEAIVLEIRQRKGYLGDSTVETIYFGGGTPSILDEDEIKVILDEIENTFKIGKDPEITLEANPDDLNRSKIRVLKESGINRLSIGIQSFNKNDLEFLGRIHDDQDAIRSIRLAQDQGIHNLNIDLIYGIPVSDDERWFKNLETFHELDIPHLSAYALTIEPKTIYHVRMKKGVLPDVDDRMISTQFFQLRGFAENNKIQHYEISNFAKEGFISKHNTNYWRHKKYLGVGPSAHSFNLQSRQWNMALNRKYARSVMEEKKYYELEELSDIDRFNEYLMLGLRTMWGCDLNKLKSFPVDIGDSFYKTIGSYLEAGYLSKELNKISLTPKGMILSDMLISKLFLD